MKKQIVSACALIASVAAFATSVPSANTFGVLKIPVSSTATEVVIPVPWAAVGTGDNAVKIIDFVLATGRKTGDKLYWYDANNRYYKVWEVNSNTWTPLQTIRISSWDSYGLAEASNDDTIERGEAAILILKEAGEGNDVYLSGQYSIATATTTVYGLTTEEVQFANKGKTHSTLIAAPKAAECDLNSDLSYYNSYTSDSDNAKFTGSMVGDKIMVFNGDNYEYGIVAGQEGCKWYKIDESGDRAINGVTIPLGTGAWYIRKNEGNVVIKWN